MIKERGKKLFEEMEKLVLEVLGANPHGLRSSEVAT